MNTEPSNEQLADNAIIEHSLCEIVDDWGFDGAEAYIKTKWLGKNAETILNRLHELHSLHTVPMFTECMDKFAELK